MLEQIIQIGKTNYERGPEFFLNSNRYSEFSVEINERGLKPEDLVSISLECSGHGSFKKQSVAQRFIDHLSEILRYSEKIKKIKLKISGFDLNQELNTMSMKENSYSIIRKIVSLLGEKINTLTSLEIRVSNVTNCTEEDFKSILNLGVNLQAKELTNLSCEFSDWTFKHVDRNSVLENLIYEKGVKKNDHDRKDQPPLEYFLQMLHEPFENTLGAPMLDLKKFRLEISTWYYSDFEMESFFYGTENNQKMQKLPNSDKIPKRIEYFHNEFKSKVEALILNIMPNLTNMELDLRNWHKSFEMGVLKTALLNISNQERRNSLSQISRRQEKTKVLVKSMISMVLKNKANEKIKEIEEEEKEIYFDFNVVI